MLTHMVSHERVKLPQGTWHLEGSADGSDTVLFGFMRDDDEGIVLDVDQQFKVTVMRSPDGTFILVKGGKSVPLEHDMVAHKLGKCSVPIELNGVITMEVGVFRMGRHAGMQVFWNLHDVHSTLGLTHSWKSKWVHKSVPRWKSYLKSMVGSSEHFIMSSFGGTLIDKQPWSVRCLPWPAVSSMGLLALLGRFCSSCKNTGGLQDILCLRKRFVVVCCCVVYGCRSV